MDQNIMNETTYERSWPGDDQLQENYNATKLSDTCIYDADKADKDDTSANCVNFEDIESFMTILCGDTNPTLQTFCDSKNGFKKNLNRIFHDMTEDNVSELVALNKEGAGIFVMVNQGDGIGRKAENVVKVRALFVDLDGSPLQPIHDAGLTPHIIVESSPERYHAYWLVEDCPLEKFKPLQQAIARRFNGDLAVNDLPRVMRIAGFMHKKKEPFLSHILETHDLPKFKIEQIISGLRLTVTEQEEHKPSQKKKTSANAKLIGALNSIDPVAMEYDMWRNIGFALHHELGADGQSIFDSWSQTDTARYSPEAINTFWQSIKINPDKPVTIGTIFKMAKDRGWSAPPAVIEELNKKYFVSNDSGKVSIYSEEYDEVMERRVLLRSSFADFGNFHNNKKVIAGKNANGDNKYEPKGNFWIKHPDRRQFEGIIMAPEKTVINKYNLWRGFSVEPVKGSWQLMQDHIKENLCLSDTILFEYVLGWMARAVQLPGKPGEVALVLQGGRGTGKGMFGNWFCKLFGQHGWHVTHGKHVTGHFNSHLRDCVFLFADEAFWAGDKQGENALKGLITEPTIAIEAKGKDVISTPNMLHILMASNNDWVVPAGIDERRYCVLKVSDKKQQDEGYFGAIAAEMNNGGLEAMLYDLQHLDISKFSVRNVPQTVGLQEQKLQSLDPFNDWWYNRLLEGSLVATEGSYWGDIPTQILYSDYIKASGQVGVSRKATTTQFGLLLPKVLPDHYPVKSSKTVDKFGYKWFEGDSTRCNHYSFPTLEKARTHFEKLLGCSIKWNDQATAHVCTTSGDEFSFKQ